MPRGRRSRSGAMEAENLEEFLQVNS